MLSSFQFLWTSRTTCCGFLAQLYVTALLMQQIHNKSNQMEFVLWTAPIIIRRRSSVSLICPCLICSLLINRGLSWFVFVHLKRVINMRRMSLARSWCTIIVLIVAYTVVHKNSAPNFHTFHQILTTFSFLTSRICCKVHADIHY